MAAKRSARKSPSSRRTSPGRGAVGVAPADLAGRLPALDALNAVDGRLPVLPDDRPAADGAFAVPVDRVGAPELAATVEVAGAAAEPSVVAEEVDRPAVQPVASRSGPPPRGGNPFAGARGRGAVQSRRYAFRRS
ncbi:hypothetical protein [Polymorphospora rubra]|uniref:hypothetical protein n=1 Tax=Polymorphospora rubra TaxID=338584 RepID=UPI00340CA634